MLYSSELMQYYLEFPQAILLFKVYSYALLTRPPLAIILKLPPRHVAVRLACVKHAASVQSEPGSNSSCYLTLFLLLYFIQLKLNSLSSTLSVRLQFVNQSRL